MVLVAEDEPLLRLHALELVEKAGFAAVEATNADDAILILESRADIRIVFTNIQMPGSMDGMRLAQAIRQRWPPIELIIVSGKAAPNPNDIPERGQFFAEPYDPAAVVRAIRSLASRAPTS